MRFPSALALGSSLAERKSDVPDLAIVPRFLKHRGSQPDCFLTYKRSTNSLLELLGCHPDTGVCRQEVTSEERRPA